MARERGRPPHTQRVWSGSSRRGRRTFGQRRDRKIRHKELDGEVSQLSTYPMVGGGGSFAEASADFRFATAVAGFGMLVRDSPHKAPVCWEDVIARAEAVATTSQHRYRREFVDLARLARDARFAEPDSAPRDQ